jgi:hypothetical protein
MNKRHFLQSAALALAAVSALPALPALAADTHSSHPSIKRPYNLPPQADLVYTIKASQRGINISGDATVQWRHTSDTYSIHTVSHAGIFGKILENHSEGGIDEYGLAPESFTEKRFRKDPTTATFHRDSKTITFKTGDESYPIKGGEQDRTSAPWQLVAQARSAPDKLAPGSEWAYFVAGRRDAEPWVFKVVKRETIQTGAGEFETIHFIKSPPKSDKSQQVDLWLAPGLDWYPVRIRFIDDDGDYVDQLLEKVVKK